MSTLYQKKAKEQAWFKERVDVLARNEPSAWDD